MNPSSSVTTLGFSQKRIDQLAQPARVLTASKRAEDLLPVIADIQNAGLRTLREIAAELNERRITTARGGAWSAVQVQRVLQKSPKRTAATGGAEACAVPLSRPEHEKDQS